MGFFIRGFGGVYAVDRACTRSNAQPRLCRTRGMMVLGRCFFVWRSHKHTHTHTHTYTHTLRFSICVYVYICMRMYMCVHVCAYRCMCIFMYMYICMSVYMYTYAFIYARVWVYIYTRVGAFCLFVLSNLSTTCACITGVSYHLHVCVGGNWKWGLFQLVHNWRLLLAWEAMFWQGKR